MGIEPTRDFVEPHTGFEDQERHQAARHLHPRSIINPAIPSTQRISCLKVYPAFPNTKNRIGRRYVTSFGECRQTVSEAIKYLQPV